MPLKFDTAIIHLFDRLDRQANVNALKGVIPDAEIVPAFAPTWLTDKESNSILGSSISHLRALQRRFKSSVPVMLLEDDAVPTEDLRELATLGPLPADCGVLLVGSETPVSFFDSNGFYVVESPFNGAHGVIYNVPLLRKKDFMTRAWERLATTPIGPKYSCYEGILDAAVRDCGLRCYRMEGMPFATYPSVSERTGQVSRARHALPPGQVVRQEPKADEPLPMFSK